MRAYIGLGSNLGDRQVNLRAALAQLPVSAMSSVYETEPVDALPPAYLNAVAAIDTDLLPEALLDQLQSVESALGRVRSFAGAPRPIDLDILLYEERVLQTPRLTIPHPRLTERAFALRPLLEIAPRLRDPRTGRPLAEALARLHVTMRRL